MNSPANSTWEMARSRRVARRVLGVAAIVLLIFIAIDGIKSPTAIGVLTCLLAMLGLEKMVGPRLDRFKTREGDAVRGAKAEDTVGAILNGLPKDQFQVLHDVRSKSGNIDHLVVRNDGAVFLIETKSHAGTINKQRAQGFIKQTHNNIFWLRDFLKPHLRRKIWINAAIVFPNADVTVRQQIRGVDIIGIHFLKQWMAKAGGNPKVAQSLWGITRSWARGGAIG